MKNDARRSLALSLDAIARTVSASTVEAEMGSMCRESYFQTLQRGSVVTQQEVDDASHAFSTLTARLMPPALVLRFIEQACAARLLPEVDYADLVPGFTADEAIASADAATRLASPMKKFTQEEALGCLRWNQAEPQNPLGIAYFIHLLQAYVEMLRQLVARHSNDAAEKMVPFALQWAPKNVLKFLNVALFVTGRKRAGGGEFVIDQPLIEEAMDLLNRSGAFTWDLPPGLSSGPGAVQRIHCPAQAFLHKLVAREPTLMTVLAFVAHEAALEPPAPEIALNLDRMQRYALAEQTGIRTFGQEWSRMKVNA